MSHLPKCNYCLLSPPKRCYLQQVSNLRLIVVFILTNYILAVKLSSVLLVVVKESLLLVLPGEERVTEQCQSKLLVDVYEFFINKFHKTLFISWEGFWHMTSLDIIKAICKVSYNTQSLFDQKMRFEIIWFNCRFSEEECE